MRAAWRVLAVLALQLLAPALAEPHASSQPPEPCAEAECPADVEADGGSVLQLPSAKGSPRTVAALLEANRSSIWPFTSPSHAPGGCEKYTGGKCLLFGCKATRNADCEQGHCTCRPNFCSTEAGECEIPKSTLKVNVARVDASHPQFPAPHDSIDTAICFSGGGARAGSLSLGAVRALENLKLMSKVDALSACSGSLFVAVNYMFAGPSMYKWWGDLKDKDQPLWGRPSEPSKLTTNSLDYDTPPLGTPFADGWGGTWGTVKAVLNDFVPSLSRDPRETNYQWRNLMRSQFLEPFSLDGKDNFLAADDAAVARIKAANPQLKNFSFLVPQPGKPKVFVITATILALEGQKKIDAASFQISPDYVGTPFRTNLAHRPLYEAALGERVGSHIVGGGLVETFGVGGPAPADQDGSPVLASLPSPPQPFTLADAMSAATYADFLPSESIFGWTPTYDYWPIGNGKEPAHNYQIGDGGFIEDTSLLPMLQRRAKKVALFLFVGPGQQIGTDVDYCDLASQIEAGQFETKTFEPSGKIADSVYVMFGYGYDDGMWHKSHNTVFKQAEMFPVACELQKLKKQGKPQVYKATHAVQPNEYWGITGDYSVEILYVYNDQLPEFEALLPSDTRAALKDGDLKGFPTDLAAGLYLKPRVINLMAAQQEYVVLQNAAAFKELLR
eukprot:CAMPEP_0179051974 /NCGR_PEP_ID=MMETSP0796-20121207/21518_1 /TAXON_ID=73915 /ORGANISM="Pyrodinium bahamense, Strain pbaha01" /LENGTH=672 /DNA_ID=CAMNT_0020748525 /DNA_START=7 /DNA_END=2025 /DNA_ORIENTATION=-